MHHDLSDVTCWLGHEIQQEQWHTTRTRDVDGSDVVTYETVCQCGETIRVIMADGSRIEEDYIP